MGKGAKPVPAREFLIGVLDYDPATGALLWKPREPLTPYDRCFNRMLASKPAGGLCGGRADGTNAYVRIGIRTDRCEYFAAHRLIWMIMTGEQPPDMIDHRDGDELNLKWENLRAATNGQNLQNSKLRQDNKSGVKGVCWHKGHRKWRARISVAGRHIWLGRFDTVNEAASVINAERARLHGEFARLS